jgi:hypothetical protein
VSPTHIGLKSLEFSRGSFSMAESTSRAIQIGFV